MTTYYLVNTFQMAISSRHRRLDTAAAAERRYRSAFRRANPGSARCCIEVMAGPSDATYSDLRPLTDDERDVYEEHRAG